MKMNLTIKILAILLLAGTISSCTNDSLSRESASKLLNEAYSFPYVDTHDFHWARADFQKKRNVQSKAEKREKYG